MTQVDAPAKPHALTGPEMAAILAIIVTWGVNNAAGKLATEVMPPLLVGALRFLIATLCLFPFVRPPFPDWRSLVLIVFVGGALQYGLLYVAYWLAQDVSPVTVANQLWIPLTTLFAFLLLKERLGKAALAGMIIAFAGVGWMMLDAHALQDWRAILVGIAAGAAWALTTVVARRTTSIPPLKMQGLLAAGTLPVMAFGSAVFGLGLAAVGRDRLVGSSHDPAVLAGSAARGRACHALSSGDAGGDHPDRLGLHGRRADAADTDGRRPGDGRGGRRGPGGAGPAVFSRPCGALGSA